METQSLGSHQHSWWLSCFSLREKLARSHNKKMASNVRNHFVFFILFLMQFEHNDSFFERSKLVTKPVSHLLLLLQGHPSVHHEFDR